MNAFHLRLAVRILDGGGVIAYPTEAVWGLGCDPDDQQACLTLLQIKQRPVEKGMILVAGHYQQIARLLAPLTAAQRDQLQKSWPGPTTWLIPDLAEQIPYWVKGEHASVAVRVSAHPQVRSLCEMFGGPIISTSANQAGQRPATTRLQLARAMHQQVDYVLPGVTGGALTPSRIIDLVSGRVLR